MRRHERLKSESMVFLTRETGQRRGSAITRPDDPTEALLVSLALKNIRKSQIERKDVKVNTTSELIDEQGWALCSYMDRMIHKVTYM